MRRWALSLLIGLGVVVACDTTEDAQGPQGISPQPQPNRHVAEFRAPCTAGRCGDAPESLKNPRCTPNGETCSWADPNGTASYRQCPAADCGVAPGADICPAGTLFKGNTCGSENEGPCAWTTACVEPRSTTSCPDPEACREMPAIGVICSDGGSGGLECMQFKKGCSWQPTCE